MESAHEKAPVADQHGDSRRASPFDGTDGHLWVESVDASYNVESHDKGLYVRTTTAVKMPREYSEDALVYVRESSLRKARFLLGGIVSRKPFALDEILLGIGSACIGIVLGAVAWKGEPMAILNSLLVEVISFPGLLGIIALLTSAFLRCSSVKKDGSLAERALECLADPDDCVEEAKDEHQ